MEEDEEKGKSEYARRYNKRGNAGAGATSVRGGPECEQADSDFISPEDGDGCIRQRRERSRASPQGRAVPRAATQPKRVLFNAVAI